MATVFEHVSAKPDNVVAAARTWGRDRTLACLDCTMNVIGALVLILMVLFACHQVAHLPDPARAACPTAAC